MTPRPPSSTLFPYTTLFRSDRGLREQLGGVVRLHRAAVEHRHVEQRLDERVRVLRELRDRKSTRLNSSHVEISYAVFCLKKKNIKNPVAISVGVPCI